MITALAFSVLGGLAVSSFSHRRAGRLASGMVAVAFLAESWPAPVPVQRTRAASHAPHEREPVPPKPSAHPLAVAIAALPGDAVLVDLPFGALPDELWWQYLSIGHWRPRLNGYSGDFPPGHLALQQTLEDLPDAIAVGSPLPAAAMADLRRRGATHVLLHRDAWPTPDAPDALGAWLRAQGATAAADVGSTEIWRLRP
jgi:hypothetical protein